MRCMLQSAGVSPFRVVVGVAELAETPIEAHSEILQMHLPRTPADGRVELL